MKTCALSFVSCALLFASSCVVATTPPPPVVVAPTTGALSFDWSFGGDTSCVDADVSDLDIDVLDAVTGDVVVSDHGEPCTGAGITITGIPAGTFDVDVTAFDPRGNAIFAGSFSADIVAGETTDAGLITLSPPGAPPPAG
jgi:hypothetical protein